MRQLKHYSSSTVVVMKSCEPFPIDQINFNPRSFAAKIN